MSKLITPSRTWAILFLVIGLANCDTFVVSGEGLNFFVAIYCLWMAGAYWPKSLLVPLKTD